MQLIGLPVSGIAYIHMEAHLLGATLLGSIPGQGWAAPERLVPIVCLKQEREVMPAPKTIYLTIAGHRR